MQASPYSAGLETYKFSDPCDYFMYGKAKASTLSLSVLVAIEMFNAMNALSEVSSNVMPDVRFIDWTSVWFTQAALMSCAQQQPLPIFPGMMAVPESQSETVE